MECALATCLIMNLSPVSASLCEVLCSVGCEEDEEGSSTYVPIHSIFIMLLIDNEFMMK